MAKYIVRMCKDGGRCWGAWFVVGCGENEDV